MSDVHMILRAIKRNNVETINVVLGGLGCEMESSGQTSIEGDLKEWKGRGAEFISHVKIELGMVKMARGQRSLNWGGVGRKKY